MWSPRVAKALARLAAPGATLSTWSVARSVRDALSPRASSSSAGQDSGDKREMLVGRFVPRGRARAAPAPVPRGPSDTRW